MMKVTELYKMKFWFGVFEKCMEWRKKEYSFSSYMERKTLEHMILFYRIWAVSCDKVKTAIVDQIHKWTSDKNCPEGQPGEKCLYTVG